MGGKQVEGNQDQRRAKAREARREGELPSASGTTTGASKQRHHLDQGEGSHRERLDARRRGKQDSVGEGTGGTATPRPGRPDRDTY